MFNLTEEEMGVMSWALDMTFEDDGTPYRIKNPNKYNGWYYFNKKEDKDKIGELITDYLIRKNFIKSKRVKGKLT